MASDGHPPEPEPEPENKDGVATTAAAAAGPGISYPYNQQFTCCVCLELLYKPVVISCGHMLCFWCVHYTMDMYKETLCAVCRQPYKHFPRICELMHHLLLKLEPAEYRRREKDILEEEKRTRTYSPQIIEFLNSKNNDLGNDEEKRNEDSKTRPPQVVSLNGSVVDQHSKKIKLEDVSCPLCKGMLYEPAVLNCGHVYCVSCLSLNEEELKCHVCGSLHPGNFPNICRDIDHFLEKYFPAEYESRAQKVQSKRGQCYREGLSSGKSAEGSSQAQNNEDRLNALVGVGCYSEGSNQAQEDEDRLDINIGVVCDSCGVRPIPGNRYRCMDCRGFSPGFNLCEACYSSGSKITGRFNQKHTPDHRMELNKSAHYRTLLAEVMSIDLALSARVADAQIDNQGMEDGNDEGLGEAAIEEPVAPGAMPVVMDDQETEGNGEEGQEL